ncbi:acetylglutamate kinase [Candidatus Woesearchaeota archaeon]|nr:acetylglutamate kinase [Candidatus Woesearchaeota archaeon]
MPAIQPKMTPNEKTKVLIEALPYIERYHNKTVVIKLGGNAMSEIRNATEDIAFLKRIGIKVVVVHGGGPEIDKELKKLGIAPKFINGLRYTDEKIIKAVEKIFQRINKRIVGKLKSKGVKTISAVNCIDVRQKSKDLGLVGEITKIDKDKLLKHLASGYVPVISPIGIGKQNQRYNINADTAASRIAVALAAEKLTILTNVDGVVIGDNLLSHIDFKTAKREIKNGNINNGMIPKVEACIYAVKNKCPKAHLINGLIPHSLLLEIFTDKGIGTEVVYKNGNK